MRVLTGGGCISGCLSPKRVSTMVTTTQQTGPHYSWLCCRDESSKQRTMLGTRVKQQREGATVARAAHVMLWSSRSDYLRILSAMTIITKKIVEPFLYNLEKKLDSTLINNSNHKCHSNNYNKSSSNCNYSCCCSSSWCYRKAKSYFSLQQGQ